MSLELESLENKLRATFPTRLTEEQLSAVKNLESMRARLHVEISHIEANPDTLAWLNRNLDLLFPSSTPVQATNNSPELDFIADLLDMKPEERASFRKVVNIHQKPTLVYTPKNSDKEIEIDAKLSEKFLEKLKNLSKIINKLIEAFHQYADSYDLKSRESNTLYKHELEDSYMTLHDMIISEDRLGTNIFERYLHEITTQLRAEWKKIPFGAFEGLQVVQEFKESQGQSQAKRKAPRPNPLPDDPNQR